MSSERVSPTAAGGQVQCVLQSVSPQKFQVLTHLQERRHLQEVKESIRILAMKKCMFPDLSICLTAYTAWKRSTSDTTTASFAQCHRT